MIPSEYWESEDRAADEQPDVADLSDDVIAIGAAYGIPSHIREFIRRQHPEVPLKSEEQIALEDIGAEQDVQIRENEVFGLNLDSDIEFEDFELDE